MYNCTKINRTSRFIIISNSTYNFIEINRTSTGCTDFLILTWPTDLRPSTAHIVFLKSTECTGLRKLTELLGSLMLIEPMCLVGLTGGKDLQTLAGHTTQVY